MDSTDLFARRARDGDENSLVRLYERLAPALYAWARLRLRHLNSAIEAEDVVQEVWFRTLSAFPRFEDREKSGFRSWIFGIAARVFVELMRKRGRNPARLESQEGGDVPAEVTSITQALKRRETVTAMIDRIDELAPEDRRLFIHRGLEGQSAATVAKLLGIGTEAVHKRWQRLRETLASEAAWRELVDDD